VNAPSFPAIRLKGTDQTLTVVLKSFTVNDPRGTGEGWRVVVEAAQLAEVDPETGNYVVGGKTLAPGSLRMVPPEIASSDALSPGPRIPPGPYTIDDGSAVMIAQAAVGAGTGRYTFGPTTLTLTVPASAYARTYQSNVMVSIVSGP